MKSIIKSTFWTVWTVLSLLLLGTFFTNIEITNRFVEKGLFYCFLLGLFGLMTIQQPWTLGRKALAIFTLFALFVTFQYYSNWKGDWRTQTIIYQNRHLASRTIEFQLQDKGALGFNRRVIDRTKIAPFISWTRKLTDEELNHIDPLTWDKVDRELNEVGFKGG